VQLSAPLPLCPIRTRRILTCGGHDVLQQIFLSHPNLQPRSSNAVLAALQSSANATHSLQSSRFTTPQAAFPDCSRTTQRYHYITALCDSNLCCHLLSNSTAVCVCMLLICVRRPQYSPAGAAYRGWLTHSSKPPNRKRKEVGPSEFERDVDERKLTAP
jgi:hypothetical protein